MDIVANGPSRVTRRFFCCGTPIRLGSHFTPHLVQRLAKSERKKVENLFEMRLSHFRRVIAGQYENSLTGSQAAGRRTVRCSSRPE